MSDVARLRTLHGLSTAAWIGDGLHEVGESHWLALSGAMHADYNLALCHGPGGDAHLPACIDALTTRRRPGIIAVAGETCGRVEPLTDAGWVRVGGAPLMTVDTTHCRPDAHARPLAAGELPLARDLAAETFALPPDAAEIALPTRATPGRTVWGLFVDRTLVSSLIAVQVEEAMVVWSMATSPSGRHRGYGSRLLAAALADSRATGGRIGLLHASEQGEPFYLTTGFRVVERWQFWSRRRWVLPSR